MPGAASRRQPHPQQPLLGGLDEVHASFAAVAARNRDREAAHLADRFGHPGEQVGPVVDQPLGPVLAAVLLVGDEGEHQIPRRDDALAFEVPGDGQHHPAHVFHIHRAAAPHVAVAHRTRERVDAPVGGLGGDDVEVPVEEQRPTGRVGAGKPGEDIAAIGGAGLDVFRVVAHVAELIGDPPGALRLAHRGFQLTGVGGIEADQGADESDHLVRRNCHAPFLPLTGAEGRSGGRLPHP